jgi:hypothetical protein
MARTAIARDTEPSLQDMLGVYLNDREWKGPESTVRT